MDNHGIHPPYKRQRVTLRIGSSSLWFAQTNENAEYGIDYEARTTKSGISMAANLREAFRTSVFLANDTTKARVLIDTPTLLIPIDEFEDTAIEAAYHHVYAGRRNEMVVYSIVPNLDVVAVFGINKDLKMVIEDHYGDVRYHPIEQPVWNFLHKRSFVGTNAKLYAFFHDNKVSVCSFDKNRFRFSNTFDGSHVQDIVFFLLYVWQQLGLEPLTDELHLLGETPERETLTKTLRRYLKKVYIINPSAEFNRAPITKIERLPFDLTTLFIKGV